MKCWVSMSAGTTAHDSVSNLESNHELTVKLFMESVSRWFDPMTSATSHTSTHLMKQVLNLHEKHYAGNYLEDQHVGFPIPGN